MGQILYCKDCPNRRSKMKKVENDFNEFNFISADKMKKCLECHMRFTEEHLQEIRNAEKMKSPPKPA